MKIAHVAHSRSFDHSTLSSISQSHTVIWRNVRQLCVGCKFSLNGPITLTSNEWNASSGFFFARPLELCVWIVRIIYIFLVRYFRGAIICGLWLIHFALDNLCDTKGLCVALVVERWTEAIDRLTSVHNFSRAFVMCKHILSHNETFFSTFSLTLQIHKHHSHFIVTLFSFCGRIGTVLVFGHCSLLIIFDDQNDGKKVKSVVAPSSFIHSEHFLINAWRIGRKPVDCLVHCNRQPMVLSGARTQCTVYCRAVFSECWLQLMFIDGNAMACKMFCSLSQCLFQFPFGTWLRSCISANSMHTSAMCTSFTPRDWKAWIKKKQLCKTEIYEHVDGGHRSSPFWSNKKGTSPKNGK